MQWHTTRRFNRDKSLAMLLRPSLASALRLHGVLSNCVFFEEDDVSRIQSFEDSRQF